MIPYFLNAPIYEFPLLFSVPISDQVYELVYCHLNDLLLVRSLLDSDIPEQLGRSHRETSLLVGVLRQFIYTLDFLLHKLVRRHLSESLYQYLNLVILEHYGNV